MKKILSFFTLLSFVFWGAGLFVLPVKADTSLEAGDIIKTEDSAALYYLAEDGKLYVFPNAKTYFSWFDDFSDVEVIDDEDFAEYELGGSVYYQPGSLLIKTPTSLKVYAVGFNGELRWIESEELAKRFYGENWNLLVDDVPDGFFVNYNMGESIDEEEDYDPDTLEEEAPTISHNKGFKAKKRIQKAKKRIQERRCDYLKKSVNRLQKRAERWGLEIPSLGEDFVNQCSEVDTDDDVEDEEVSEREGRFIYICKVPPGNPEAEHTIKVSKRALRAHLKTGSYIGKCDSDEEEEEDEEEDEDEEEEEECDDEEDCDDEDEDEEEDSSAPVITNIEVEAGITSATITWTTDEEADSKVEYDMDDSFEDEESSDSSDLVTEHMIELDDLEASTTYYFLVSSSDEEDNTSESELLSFTTIQEEEEDDSTGPVISELDIVIGSTTARITWTTDEESDSKVRVATESFDTTSEYETFEDDSLSLEHSILLDDLATSTMYYFLLSSSDEYDNTSESDEDTFTTLD